MPYSSALKNAWLNQLRNVAGFLPVAQTYVSAHTASPGDTGVNEVSGGSPAYARKALNLGAASGGSEAGTNQPVLDIPTGVTVTHLGLWTASSGGTFLGYADVTDEVFASQGTYTVSAATLNLNA